jgi:hypothetical protein
MREELVHGVDDCLRRRDGQLRLVDICGVVGVFGILEFVASPPQHPVRLERRAELRPCGAFEDDMAAGCRGT